MATQPAPLSPDEFHRQYDGEKPYYEYWFGKAIQKPMPTWLHAAVQLILSSMLERLGWTAGPEVRLKVIKEAEPVPDIVAIHGKAQPGHQTTPPELCVEILSSKKELRYALWKGRRYLDWGTRFVWIIDPQARIAWLLTSVEGKAYEERIRREGMLTAGPDTCIALPDLFAQVDERIEN
jgi:Uma2 family endonuclease